MSGRDGRVSGSSVPSFPLRGWWEMSPQLQQHEPLPSYASEAGDGRRAPRPGVEHIGCQGPGNGEELSPLLVSRKSGSSSEAGRTRSKVKSPPPFRLSCVRGRLGRQTRASRSTETVRAIHSNLRAEPPKAASASPFQRKRTAHARRRKRVARKGKQVRKKQGYRWETPQILCEP